jgi:hypothetical protein
MHVVAQTREPDGAALEWDLKLSVFIDGKTRAASIATGSFTLASHAKHRVPRRPIAGLVVRLDGVAEPAEARIVGVPNAANGVVGEFPEPYAERLFDALDAGTPFTVGVTYDSGERETVRVRAINTDFNRNFFHHGSDAPTRKCLALLIPASEPLNRVVERDHPWRE